MPETSPTFAMSLSRLVGLLTGSAAVLFVAFAVAPGVAVSKSSGANPGFAGDLTRSDGSPQTCAVCHSTFGLGEGEGAVTIDVADTAEPGEAVPISVTVVSKTPPAEGGALRQGFQATVRDPATGDLWGRLVLVDAANTQFSSDAEEYVTHTTGGMSQTSWTLEWEPGTEREGIARVYVAGNAADGDGSTSGDYVYATTADVAVSGVATEPAPRVAFDVGPPYPHPVRVGTVARLDLQMERPGAVAAHVVDGRGRVVREVMRDARGAATVAVRTDGLAPGTYFVVVEGPGGRRTQPLVVVR